MRAAKVARRILFSSIPALPLVGGCETQAQLDAVLKAEPSIATLANFFDVHQRHDPTAMLQHAHEFDAYPRSGQPKVFVSEYSSPRKLFANSTTLGAAVAEAAYMAGIEANGDVVALATYGDLLAKISRD